MSPSPSLARELPRKLGLLDSLAIVVGNVIGSAIFLVPSSIAQTLPATSWIMAVWIFAGVISLFGALAFAELGAMIPATGGQYVFLREAYGPFWAFLFGWALFLVIRSGGTATLAVGFAIYVSYFVPLTYFGSKLTVITVIAILTFVNYRGVEAGAAVQKVFTLLKIAGLSIVIAGAFASRQAPGINWSAAPAGFSMSQFGIAMIACLWAYQGWFAISWVAGEVKRPERNLPLSLGFGVAIVIVTYLLANLAYLNVLSIPEIASTERVAATAAERSIGRAGATLVSATILVSIFGALNAGILSAPRVYFAQARDGLFFKKFGEVHPRFQTPSFSILMQGIWASILAVSGTYEKLFSYVIFTSWLFYGLTVAGVLVLRRKRPDLPRPYKMWGYPVAPLVFVLVAFGFVLNTIVTKPWPSIVGLLLIATGIPAYYFWRPRNPA